MNEKKTRGELPLTDAEAEAAGLTRPIGPGMEIVLDNNFVSIPLSRFEDLIQAEVERDAAVRALVEVPKYNLQIALRIVFGLREGDICSA